MSKCIKCSAPAKHDPVGGVPTTCGRHSAAHAERMRKLHADPEFNPLAALSERERADYDVLKKAGYTREEALAAEALIWASCSPTAAHGLRPVDLEAASGDAGAEARGVALMEAAE